MVPERICFPGNDKVSQTFRLTVKVVRLVLPAEVA
jgi:hypothetical protein